MNEWMNEQMNERTLEWTNEWMNECDNKHNCVYCHMNVHAPNNPSCIYVLLCIGVRMRV